MPLKTIRLTFFAALAISACAPTAVPPEIGFHRSAVVHLKAARRESLTTEQRAALYLESAKKASALLDSESSGEPARIIYNQAASELTMLLRSANNGKLWNHTITLNSGATLYHLHFAKGTRDGVWDPA